MTSIGDVTKRVSTLNPAVVKDLNHFDYIDLSAIDQTRKEITGATRVSAPEAPSRARQLVAAGDVIVSTVRPNLNAVAVVSAQLDGAIASTGFTVLRPTDEIAGQYLFHWVRSRRFIDDMVSKATGASYPAISDRIVKDSTLPLPTIDEQRRIASILDQADAVQIMQRRRMTLLDELPRLVFLDMFGHPIMNPKRLPTVPLNKLGQLDRGVSKHRPRNDPALLGGAHPLIQTGEVANSGGYIRKHSRTYSDLGLDQSKLWPAGTLCITIAANIAKAGILTFDACFPDSVVGFTSDKGTANYVRFCLGFLQETLEAAAPQSAQKNINLAILRTLEVPLPDRVLMNDFSNFVDAVEKKTAMSEVALSGASELGIALQTELLSQRDSST